MQPTEPQFLAIDSPLGKDRQPRRVAWYDWNATGQAHPAHWVVCVHGLTRQARDFDALARVLAPRARVLCVDVAGRGASDWLAQAEDYQIATYIADMQRLLAHWQAQYRAACPEAPPPCIDWVGTSMGGLIAMGLTAQPGHGVRRLVLNDVGPELETAALRRIGSYVGQNPCFASEAEALASLQAQATAFGPHDAHQWQALLRPMLRACPDGWRLHYDPALAVPLRQWLTLPEPDPAVESPLWLWYDAMQLECLLLRGAESDLLRPETAQAMAQRGPRARCVEFAGVGHAPALQHAEQIAVIEEFLFAP